MRRSVHRLGGIFSVNRGRFSLNSVALRGPGMTAADDRVGERELQRGGRQRDVVRLANGGDLLHARYDIGWRGFVVPGVSAGEDAGVQRAADHQGGAAGLAQRNEVVERRLFQQGVAAGEQEGVPVAEAERVDQHLGFVYADADGADDAGAAKLF